MRVEPPEDAIETTASIIWMADGIIHSQLNGTERTAETVDEDFAVVRRLVAGVPRPQLWDVRKWPGSDAGAWRNAITSIESTFTATAMLIDSESSIGFDPFAGAINRLIIPYQQFTNEDDALAFLRGHIAAATQPMSVPDSPSDAIETASWIVWLEEGVVMARSRGVFSTGESADEFFSIVRQLVGGTPRPLLYDAREWPGGDATAWASAVSNMDSMLTAVAMLIEPESSAGASPFALDRLLIPFRLFTDPAEAIAFLRRFQASE